MLAALCDVHSGEQCGVINVYLQPDGRDRLRDKKGKTVIVCAFPSSCNPALRARADVFVSLLDVDHPEPPTPALGFSLK